MRTAVFDTVNSLRPFFFSLREIKENISLDIKIPANWKTNEVLAEFMHDVGLTIQDQNEKNLLISIISTATKDGYDAVFSAAKKIIKANQEQEEKVKLFNVKVEELKTLFLSSPLDKLKEISFIKDDVRNKKGIGEAGLGDEKGSGTDSSSQTTND
jgi:hypothetical protein